MIPPCSTLQSTSVSVPDMTICDKQNRQVQEMLEYLLVLQYFLDLSFFWFEPLPIFLGHTIEGTVPYGRLFLAPAEDLQPSSKLQTLSLHTQEGTDFFSK